MNGIRVDLQLRDGSFTSGMLRAGQSVESFRREMARLDPNFRKLASSGRSVERSIRRADTVNRDFLSTLRDVSIVAGGLTLLFRSMTGASGGLLGSITKVNSEIERLKFQMLGMSTSAKPLEEAAASVEYLRKQALQAPFSLKEMANSFVKLKATGTDPMAGSLQSVVDGIAAFGGTDEQLHRVTLGIVQMSGKSVIQMEEMRQQLGESMPNAMRIMARSMGVSVAELTKAIATGRVQAKGALNAFYAELERTYGGEAQRMMESFSGQVSKLKTNLQLLATSDGMKVYFEEQKAGLKELNEFFLSDDAKKFAKSLGNALTAMIRSLRTAIKTIYEFRSEITLVAKIVSAGFAIRMLGRLALGAATHINFARLSVSTLGASLAQSVRQMRVGSSAMIAYGVSARATGIAVGGLTIGVRALGGAIVMAAPWLAAIGAAVYVAGNSMGWFGEKTEEAYDQMVKFGAESKAQAKEILADREAELRDNVASAQSSYDWDFNADRYKTEKKARIDQAKKDLEDFLKTKENLISQSESNENKTSIDTYAQQLKVMLREHNEFYRTRQVEIDLIRDEELSSMAETGKKAYQITDEFQEQTLANRQDRSKKVIATIDAEIARIKDLQRVEQDEKRLRAIGAQIDFLNGKRVEAAEQMRNLDNFGITFGADIENETTKITRGAKRLDKVNSKIRGMQAELAGAGNEFARLRFEISRGDYGSIEEGGEAVRLLHEGLLEATLQKEALDKVMEGDKKAVGDIRRLEQRETERLFEVKRKLANQEMSEAEQFQFKLKNGYYAGLGPIENIRKGIMSVVGAVDIQGEALNSAGKVMRENTFGEKTVERINATKDALSGVLEKVMGIGFGLATMNFSEVENPGSRPKGPRASVNLANPAQQTLRDLIASVESGADGYNATLDNGRWTGGPKELVKMTLDEILVLQNGMRNNPENSENRELYGNGKGSSALGRYQIVSTTLKGLIENMGLSGKELFSAELQDKMADELLKGRGDSVLGLRQEWEGLKNVSDEKILSAIAATKASNKLSSTPSLNPNAGDVPALPTYEAKALEQQRIDRTEDLSDRAEALKIKEQERIVLENQLARQKELEKILAKTAGAAFKNEGRGRNFTNLITSIEGGKLGTDRSPDADVYKELLAAARELDAIEKEAKERNRSENQAKQQLVSLEQKRAEISQLISDTQAQINDPNYIVQSDDLRRLISDLDKYVERVSAAFGATSQQATAAQQFRKNLIGDQKILDASTQRKSLAEEERNIRESLLSQYEQKSIQFQKDLDRVNQWVEISRQAGMKEVEIVRQAESMKDAIRQKFARETNPVAEQMEEWKDLSGSLASQATGWMDSMSSGVAGLITGTGSLRGAINGVINDIVTSQVRSLFANAAGDKASSALGGKGGSKGGPKGSFIGPQMPATGKMFGLFHGGGIAGNESQSMRANPSVFAKAPKFHGGGIIGGAPMPKLHRSEVPIITKKKEGIFTPDQMAALAPAGGNGNISISAPITVSGSSGTSEQNADLAKKMSKEMESTMRGVVVDEIRKQQRVGNMLSGAGRRR